MPESSYQWTCAQRRAQHALHAGDITFKSRLFFRVARERQEGDVASSELMVKQAEDRGNRSNNRNRESQLRQPQAGTVEAIGILRDL